MFPVQQRSLSPENTINIIFGIFTLLLGTLSVIVAVATWMSRHHHHFSFNGRTEGIQYTDPF